MTWTDEVHNSRFYTAVARAAVERKLRKRGHPVPVMETSSTGPVLAMVALASGLLAWQQWGPQARKVLSRHPMVQQFRTLLFGHSSSAPLHIASKGSRKAGGSTKVSARKPTVEVPTPAQAAAAAAEARMATAAAAAAPPCPQPSPSRTVPPIPSRPAQLEPQPQASTSSTTTSAAPRASASASGCGGGGGGKKKGSRKKQR